MGVLHATQNHVNDLFAQLTAYTGTKLKSDDRPPEIRLLSHEQRDNAEWDETGWSVQLPECCVVCGGSADEKIVEEKEIPDLRWPLWTVVVGIGAAPVLWCAGSNTLAITSVLGGFLLGYKARSLMRVRLQFSRCSKHVADSRFPKPLAAGTRLTVFVGNQKVRNWFQINRSPHTEAKAPAISTTDLAEKLSKASLGPIPADILGDADSSEGASQIGEGQSPFTDKTELVVAATLVESATAPRVESVPQPPGTLNNPLELAPEPSAPFADSDNNHTSIEEHVLGDRAEVDALGRWREGDVIDDRYEVTEVVGQGSMGVVYRIHHRGWAIDLALHSPSADWFQSEQQKRAFAEEIGKWCNLGPHPHTIDCHFVREIDGIPHAFAEQADGKPLEEWIGEKWLYRSGARHTLERILDFAIQVARGLHYAHNCGVIHEEVCPASVVVSFGGVARLTGFGVTRAFAAIQSEREKAGDARALGYKQARPRPYLSPEQEADIVVTPKTDIWSWAVLVLEMFTRDRTWARWESAGQALDNYAEFRAGKRSWPEMPEPIRALLQDCLCVEPEKRPESLSAVVESLSAVYQDIFGRAYDRVEPTPGRRRADRLRLWDLSSGDCLRTFARCRNLIHSVVFSPDGRFALSGGHETLDLWNLTSGDCLWAFEGHKGGLHSIAVSPDGRFAISGGLDYAIKVWDISTGTRLRTFKARGGGNTYVAIGFDGRAIVSGGKTPQLYDFSWFCGERWRAGFEVSRIVGVSMVHADDSRYRELLRTANSHEMLQDIATRLEAIREARSIPGREFLPEVLDLWCEAGRFCQRKSFRSGWLTKTFEGHASTINSVVISPDGRLAVSGSHDGTLKCWDLSSGDCLQTFEGHDAHVTCLAFSPDGRFALSGSRDKTLKLWDLLTGECLRTFEGHVDSLTSVAISSDGRFALSGSRDKTLKLWELDWEYEFPGWIDWDDRAAPYLEDFLTLHKPVGEDGISRIGTPQWSETDFQCLITGLQQCDFGWLRPEGVGAKLNEMTAEPAPLPQARAKNWFGKLFGD